MGIGVQGVTPLHVDTPLPQRSPRKTGQHSQLISLDSPAPGSIGQGVETSGDLEPDSQMDSQQSGDTAGNKEVLDVTVVSTASDWPDNVFFDSTRPSGSLPQHLQLTGGVPLPPEDSLRPTIVARRTLPPGLSPKPDLAYKFAVKRNLPFGSPLKSAKSEGGTLSEMNSFDGGAGKPEKLVLTTVRKKKRRAAVDPATIQLIIDQLKDATLVSETHQSNTIAALNSAMEEISSLRSQVESLQSTQGMMAGTLDSATLRVANCETTLQHHSQQIGSLNDSHSRILSQWDSFQQRWANNQGPRGPAQEGGHAASFFLGGVQQLRAHLCLSPQTDPVKVVEAVLRELALYCSVNRIYVANNQASSRLEARAVVLYIRSPFHKRDAMVKVKQYLARHQVREAAVRDCFPSAVMEVARNLNRYGGHLKRSQGIQRYRVIADRDGHPVLQTAKQGAGYTDHPVSVAEMEAFLASLGGSAAQQAKQTTRGKTGPNHRAKNARGTGGQQGPSANHVPQGPVRQTLHLTQAANYGGSVAPPSQPPQHQHLLSDGPDHNVQRALQDQYLQQQIAYQQQSIQQQPQQHPHLQQQFQQQPVVSQPGFQQQQSQFQQQYPALRPVVPQPGTDPTMQYGAQWPHSSTVNTVNSAVPYTSTAPPTLSGHSGQPTLIQHQGPLTDGGQSFAGPSGHQAGTPQDGLVLSDRNGQL